MAQYKLIADFTAPQFHSARQQNQARLTKTFKAGQTIDLTEKIDFSNRSNLVYYDAEQQAEFNFNGAQIEKITTLKNVLNSPGEVIKSNKKTVIIIVVIVVLAVAGFLAHKYFKK